MNKSGDQTASADAITFFWPYAFSTGKWQYLAQFLLKHLL